MTKEEIYGFLEDHPEVNPRSTCHECYGYGEVLQGYNSQNGPYPEPCENCCSTGYYLDDPDLIGIISRFKKLESCDD